MCIIVIASQVITFTFFCHNDGWLLHIRILSCGDYAFFPVHNNLKQISLTIGYVGVAHWAATMDGLSA